MDANPYVDFKPPKLEIILKNYFVENIRDCSEKKEKKGAKKKKDENKVGEFTCFHFRQVVQGFVNGNCNLSGNWALEWSKRRAHHTYVVVHESHPTEMVSNHVQGVQEFRKVLINPHD